MSSCRATNAKPRTGGLVLQWVDYGHVESDGERCCSQFFTAEQAKLAAAAPQLARALAAVEWSREPVRYSTRHSCPSCHMPRGGRHHTKCQLDAALTAAGLVTQEQREEARRWGT